MKKNDYFDDYQRAADAAHKLRMVMIDMLFEHVSDKKQRRALLMKSDRIARTAHRQTRSGK